MTYKSGFALRIKFRISPTDRIQCDQSRRVFTDPVSGHSLRLAAESDNVAITKSTTLTLTADDWENKTEASIYGKRYEDALKLALVRLLIGTDFGYLAPTSFYTKTGFAWLSREMGIENPLNDSFGLMVFQAHPRPTFVHLRGDALRAVPYAQLEEVFLAALRQNVHINEREELAINLFNTAMLSNSTEARFILHIMALESLLERDDRSEEARHHVRRMIHLTESCGALSDEERRSLLGTLSWMKKESISQAGHKLVEKRLGGRLYDGVRAGNVFKECYKIRGQLVHGDNVGREKVRAKIDQLGRLVSDILSAPALLDVGPRP